MQRTVNINGKEYPLEDEGFALNGVLEGIRSGYKELKKKIYLCTYMVL